LSKQTGHLMFHYNFGGKCEPID